MEGMIIEWAPFTLNEEATERQLLEASAELQAEFLSRQEGFVRRELLRGAGRQWVDLVYWAGADAARRAMEQAAASPVCLRYFHLMVPADQGAGAGVQHLDMVRSYRGSGSAGRHTSEAER